ncbi:hypothetical protein LXL04_025036 [Taraxacum kok-saghyz]
MGNYTSACNNFMTPPRIKSKKAARVIFPAGEIRQFQESVKAAEIMLECPNFFLVNSTSLNINRRFSPLSADEELESNNIYIMFSMRRLNSMITPADMAVFWMAANSAAKRILGRISPEMEKSGDANAAAEQRRVVVEVPEFSYRLAVCRSRKPLLDTITEEPSCRRWGMSHLDNPNINRRFQESVKAAEIMLECPNFFLVNSTSLNINRRFSPLSADEELESNNIYIMFSMRRLNSMITPADMAVFWMAANSAAKRILGRISPEMEKSGDANAAAEQRRVVVEVPEFSYRLAVCRSRKPLLDTITEEPSCRRWGMSHLDFLDTKNENENGVSRIWKRIYKFKVSNVL